MSRPPLAPVREWRFHLGAHKTATTHMQGLLAALRPALLEAGIDVLPLEDLRGVQRPFRPGRHGWRAAFGGAAARAAWLRALAPMRRGPGVLAISDENLPGVSRDLLGEILYPHAETELAALHGLGRGASLRLFLGIRPMDQTLPSAYAQSLRATDHPGGFAALAERVAARPPRWADYVARLERIAPGAPVTVWTMEAYRADPRGVIARFLGVDPGPLPETPPPTRTMTPPAAAIAAAEALPHGLPPNDKRRRVEAIYAEGIAEGGARYDPLPESLRTRLRAAYAEDLDRLRARLGDRLIEAPPPPG